MKFILALALVTSCAKRPEEVLKATGRPEPISCKRSGDSQHTCTDALGIIWTCYWAGAGGSDSECTATGQVPKEVP